MPTFTVEIFRESPQCPSSYKGTVFFRFFYFYGACNVYWYILKEKGCQEVRRKEIGPSAKASGASKFLMKMIHEVQ